MQIKTVLGLTDLEADSLTGLRTAFALAEREGAKLVVGHVLVPRTLDPANVAEFLREHGFDPSAATVEIEIDADVISGIDLIVDQCAPDFIVLSSYRKRGPTRLLFASVPVGLVGRCTAPVLAMHADRDQERFKRALVCVDGSDQGQQLVDWAAKLLDPDGEIVACMVIEDSPLVIGGVDIGLYNKEVLEKARDAAQKYVRELRTARSDLTVREDLRVGNAVDQIEAARVEHDADLVVVGTGGIGGEAIFVLGSVAEGVVRHSDVPALVVKTDRPVA